MLKIYLGIFCLFAVGFVVGLCTLCCRLSHLSMPIMYVDCCLRCETRKKKFKSTNRQLQHIYQAIITQITRMLAALNVFNEVKLL